MLRQRRQIYWAVILVAIVGGVVGTYEFAIPSLSTHNNSRNPNSATMTIIHIKRDSYIPPPNWSDIQGLSTPGYQYPYNFTVIIGINNTIEWVNNDTVEHTVIALTVPQGASYFDSGFIAFGKSFTLTLTVPGFYKYDCAWHPWLAGIINVKTG